MTNHLITDRYLRARAWVATSLDRLRAHERGEGVISAAIVVLIMAILGAAMWALFNGVFESAGSQIERNVDEIGG